MVYAQVSKTCGRKAMRVRSPLSAPMKNLSLVGRFFVDPQGIEHAEVKPVTVLARPVLKRAATEGDPLSRHNLLTN